MVLCPSQIEFEGMANGESKRPKFNGLYKHGRPRPKLSGVEKNAMTYPTSQKAEEVTRSDKTFSSLGGASR